MRGTLSKHRCLALVFFQRMGETDAGHCLDILRQAVRQQVITTSLRRKRYLNDEATRETDGECFTEERHPARITSSPSLYPATEGLM